MIEIMLLGRSNHLSATLLGMAICALAQAILGQEIPVLGRGLDRKGFVALEVPLGAIPGHPLLPAIISFTSEPSLRTNGVLPTGWLLPLVDASAQLVDESNAQALLPNGNVVYLQRSADGKWSSPSGEWTARVDDDRLDLQSEKASLGFRKGRIASYSEGTSHYQWDRDEKNGVTLIKDRAGNSVARLQLRKTGVQFRLMLEAAAVSDAKTTIEGCSPTAGLNPMGQIDRIELPGGQMIDFVNDLPADAEIRKLSMVPRKAGASTSVAWNAASGMVQEVNGATIKVSFPEPGKTLMPGISAIVEGREHPLSGAVCGSNGNFTYYGTDGVVKKELLANTASGARVRSSTVVRPDGVEEQARSWFSPAGSLIKESNKNMTRVFKDGKYQVFRDGLLVREY